MSRSQNGTVGQKTALTSTAWQPHSTRMSAAVEKSIDGYKQDGMRTTQHKTYIHQTFF